jgi:hypothetical protein
MAKITRQAFLNSANEGIQVITPDLSWDDLLDSKEIFGVPQRYSVQIAAALFDTEGNVVLPQGPLFAGGQHEKLELYNIGNAMTYPDEDQHNGQVQYEFDSEKDVLSLFATDESGLTNVDRDNGLIEADDRDFAQIGEIPIIKMGDPTSTNDITAVLKGLSLELVCEVPDSYLDQHAVKFVNSVAQLFWSKSDNQILTVDGQTHILRDLTVRFYITVNLPNKPCLLLSREHYDNLKAEGEFQLDESEWEFLTPDDENKNDFAVLVPVDGKCSIMNITKLNFFTYDPELAELFVNLDIQQVVKNVHKELKKKQTIWESVVAMLGEMNSTYQQMIGVIDEDA